MPATLESIKSLVNPPSGLVKRLSDMYSVWEKSNTSESDREKTLKKMLGLAESEAEVKQFQTMLDKAKSGKTVSITDLIEAVKATGADPVDVFRKGIMKSIGDDKYPYTPAGIKSKAAAKETAEKTAADKKAKESAK